MRVLVTGGAGYIGSRLCPALVKAGHQVRVLDTLYFGADGLQPLVDGGAVELVRGDLRDDRLVDSCLEEIDAVIHLAAMSNDPSADLDEVLTRSINRDATVALINRSSAGGIRRFVNASSATVYGVQDIADVDEDTPVAPITLYGRYKAETEAHALSCNRPGFEVTSLRAATVCGASPRLRLDLTVNLLTAQAVRHKHIRVFGGAQQRPNIHIDDLVVAYRLLLESSADAVAGSAFNVGGENLQVIEIARRVQATVEGPVEVEVLPVKDERSYHLNADRIHQALGFRPQRTVEQAIAEVAAAVDDVADIEAADHVNVRRMMELADTGGDRLGRQP